MQSDSLKKSGKSRRRRPSSTQGFASGATHGDWGSLGVLDPIQELEPIADDRNKTSARKSSSSSSSKKKKKKHRKSATNVGAATDGEEKILGVLGEVEDVLYSHELNVTTSERALHRSAKKEISSAKTRPLVPRTNHRRITDVEARITPPEPELVVSKEPAKTQKDYVVRIKDPRPRSRRVLHPDSRESDPSGGNLSPKSDLRSMEAKLQRMERQLSTCRGEPNDFDDSADDASPTSVTYTNQSDLQYGRLEARVQELNGCSGKSGEHDKSTNEGQRALIPLVAQIVQQDKLDCINKESTSVQTHQVTRRPESTLAFFLDRGVMTSNPDLEYGKIGDEVDSLAADESDDGDGDATKVVETTIEGEIFYDATAIEYDPGSKPPLHKNRRFQLYMISVILLLFVACVGAVAGIAASNSGPAATYAPTIAPSAAPSTRTEGAYVQQFVQAAGDEVTIPGTPAYRAADWIMTKDPMGLTPNSPNLIQRFILVNFYFATSRDGWRSCGAPEQGDSDDCIFERIVRLPDESQGYDQKPAVRWLSGSHECTWVGIECDEFKETAAVEVWGQNLTGTLPTCLSALHFLQSISLAHNDFTGQIPSELASVRHLVSLELQGNDLTGPIPDEYWDVDELQVLNLGDNRLNGTLSPDIAKLTDLKGIHLFQNEFSGPFPVNVPANLKYLAFMRVDNNQFTGTFHTEFGELTNLQELWCHNNKFDGIIPTEIGLMRSMTDLQVHGNDFRGTIPLEIYGLTDLFRLEISNMPGIVGTISTEVGNLRKLESLRLQRNSLTGTVPTEMALATSLRLLWLHLNDLTGPMPPSVCQNRRTGQLGILQADCLGPIECDSDCCTACCVHTEFEVCRASDEQA